MCIKIIIKIISKIIHKTKQNKRISIKQVYALAILLFISVQVWASIPDPTQDLLASAKADVISNFGPRSTLAYIVYLIEIISGVVAYIRSKNLLALLGILIVILFTTTAFMVIGA